MAAMTVFSSFKTGWQRRAVDVPILIGIRLLSLALITPLLAICIRVGVALSGQTALTDQDIAYFILSPIGFPVFLLLAGLWLIGTVIGFAIMTVSLQNAALSSEGALMNGVTRIGRRLIPILQFAVLFVLRVLALIMPAALIGALASAILLGDYDINYYLTQRPPEFIAMIAIGAGLVDVTLGLVLPRLLNWAVALHYVIFSGHRPNDAFAASKANMQSKRARLLRDLLI